MHHSNPLTHIPTPLPLNQNGAKFPRERLWPYLRRSKHANGLLLQYGTNQRGGTGAVPRRRLDCVDTRCNMELKKKNGNWHPFIAHVVQNPARFLPKKIPDSLPENQLHSYLPSCMFSGAGELCTPRSARLVLACLLVCKARCAFCKVRVYVCPQCTYSEAHSPTGQEQ